MHYSGILGLIFTSIVIIAIPGPSIMFFIGQVITHGRASALWGVIGNALGATIVAIFCAIGIGAIITKNSSILLIIRIIGATILLLIGLKYVFSSPQRELDQSDKSQKKPLLSGVIVSVSNPKALIMFGTVVPSFLNNVQKDAIYMLLQYSLVPIIIGLIVDSIWVLIAHMVKSRFVASQRGLQAINKLGGCLIILMALLLAYESMSLFTSITIR